nr:ATP-dependent sacrificial sulfur transferase LarE [Desulfobacterales bacterium]
MEPQLQKKYDRLKRIILQAGSATVAFSGGVDSTFLLKVCVDLLRDRVLAVTARSETFPARELEEAKALAGQIGVKHIIIDSEELEVPGFSDNPPHRCLLCKTELFLKVKKIAAQHDMDCVFDGSNADDQDDFRPGRVAAHHLGIRSPLEEAGLRKKEIRTLSKMLNLLTWDKPSFACLSSRFPYHTKITRPALRQVESAENYLWQLGMRVFRVRHHDSVARIELGEKEMRLLWECGLSNEISRHFKSLGYKYVTLDLEGYRTGSMNETLPGGKLFPRYQRED